MNQRLTELLKEARLRSGFKQSDVASRLGLKNNTISNWERGRNEPDMDSFIAMCRMYEVDCVSMLCEAYGTQDELSRIPFDEDTMEFASFYAKLDSGDRREARGFVRALLTKPQYKNKMNVEVAKDFGA